LLDILFKNAVKYSAGSPAPVVIFGVHCVDGATEFFVQDNGVGFEPERAERIFIPFHSYHTDIRFGGQGLGLATAQRIVERHGGHIRANGVPGAGATFTFTLADDREIHG
jgi:signal transduction histidine kinase